MTVERLQGVSLADGHTLQRYWQTTPVILEQAVDVSDLDSRHRDTDPNSH